MKKIHEKKYKKLFNRTGFNHQGRATSNGAGPVYQALLIRRDKTRMNSYYTWNRNRRATILHHHIRHSMNEVPSMRSKPLIGDGKIERSECCTSGGWHIMVRLWSWTWITNGNKYLSVSAWRHSYIFERRHLAYFYKLKDKISRGFSWLSIVL